MQMFSSFDMFADLYVYAHSTRLAIAAAIATAVIFIAAAAVIAAVILVAMLCFAIALESTA